MWAPREETQRTRSRAWRSRLTLPTARVVPYTLTNYHTRGLLSCKQRQGGGLGGIVHAHLSYPHPTYHVPTTPRTQEPNTVDARG